MKTVPHAAFNTTEDVNSRVSRPHPSPLSPIRRRGKNTSFDCNPLATGEVARGVDEGTANRTEPKRTSQNQDSNGVKRKDVSEFCPQCGLELFANHCKLICPRCRYYMSCSDYY